LRGARRNIVKSIHFDYIYKILPERYEGILIGIGEKSESVLRKEGAFLFITKEMREFSLLSQKGE